MCVFFIEMLYISVSLVCVCVHVKCEEKLEQLQLASNKISEGQSPAPDSKRMEVSDGLTSSAFPISCRNF